MTVGVVLACCMCSTQALKAEGLQRQHDVLVDDLRRLKLSEELSTSITTAAVNTFTDDAISPTNKSTPRSRVSSGRRSSSADARDKGGAVTDKTRNGKQPQQQQSGVKSSPGGRSRSITRMDSTQTTASRKSVSTLVESVSATVTNEFDTMPRPVRYAVTVQCCCQ